MMQLNKARILYFGGVSNLARLTSTSRQRVAYWVRVGYHVTDGAIRRSGGGAQVGARFDTHAAIVSAYLVPMLRGLAVGCPDVVCVPASLVPGASELLRPVGGRSLTDPAPVKEWLKWLE